MRIKIDSLEIDNLRCDPVMPQCNRAGNNNFFKAVLIRVVHIQCHIAVHQKSDLTLHLNQDCACPTQTV